LLLVIFIYDGKRIVVGHTTTRLLPQEYSSFTPDDSNDLWAGDNVIAVDTGCGWRGGVFSPRPTSQRKQQNDEHADAPNGVSTR